MLDDKTLYPTTSRNADGSRTFRDSKGHELGKLRTFVYNNDQHEKRVEQIISDGRDPLKNQIRQIIALVESYKRTKEREASSESLCAFFHDQLRRIPAITMAEASRCLLQVLNNILDLLNDKPPKKSSYQVLSANYRNCLLQSTRLRNIIRNIPFAELQTLGHDRILPTDLYQQIKDLQILNGDIENQKRQENASLFKCWSRHPQAPKDWVEHSASLTRR